MIKFLANKRLREFLSHLYKWGKNSFAVFGLFSFISILYALFLLLSISDVIGTGEHKIKEIKSDTVVYYKFEEGIPEDSNRLSFSKDLFTDMPSFFDLVFALKQISEDDRVSSFVANLDNAEFSYAQVQELRDMIKKMNKAGKKTIAYATDFGAASSAMRKYYLASAFDKIYMQPIGSVSINGIGTEIPFIKSLLEKIGVEADFVHMGKYKNFPEMFNRNSMSEDAREMMTSIIKNLSVQVIGDMSADRKIPLSEFTALVDKGFFADKESVENKLIDKLDYLDNVVTKDAVSLADYLSIADKNNFFENEKNKNKNLKRVAFVVAEGQIAEDGRDNITAKSLVKTFDDIIDDKEIEAVILRIDSPGGSAVVSETIRNAIVRTKAAGKKVVVSMSGTAASGGYWIASAADKIVANPATLTGSIGVFGGKFVLKNLWKKVGVNWSAILYGKNAPMWSANENFSESERGRISAVMESIYQNFIDRVAEGRKLKREEVLKIAEGRVWTGSQAKGIKLVDSLGGISNAIDITKKELGLSLDDKILLESFPAEKSGLEKFMNMLEDNASIFSSVLSSDFVTFIKNINISSAYSLY